MLNDDVKSCADVSAHNLSEISYKANFLPGHIVDVDKLFAPVLTSYELLPVKKAVDISRIIDYYLWAYDKKLTDSDKLKGRENYKILILLLSGITEGMYTLTEIGEKVYLKSNLSYGYTEKYNCGRLYPNKSSILHISNEFRYHLLKDLYDYVGIINAHPTILYNYAISHDISPLFVRTVSE